MRVSFLSLAVLLVVIFLLSLSFYVVNPYESALVLRLGKVVTDSNGQPELAGSGFHFKWPLLDDVNDFDMRVKTLESDSDRVMTAEQKEVSVDAYVKWKISNPLTYYQSTNSDDARANLLLQQTLQDAMRSEFGQMTISDLVDAKREQVMTDLSKALQGPAQQLGIQIIDVRLMKIELPQPVEDSIFARMKSKRENDAATYRAQGLQTAEQIKADADEQAAVIVATAKSEAAKTRASGYAQAAQILANSYSQNPGFYAFYRSLKAYQAIFANQHGTLVLRPDSQFFQYFNSMGS